MRLLGLMAENLERLWESRLQSCFPEYEEERMKIELIINLIRFKNKGGKINGTKRVL